MRKLLFLASLLVSSTVLADQDSQHAKALSYEPAGVYGEFTVMQLGENQYVTKRTKGETKTYGMQNHRLTRIVLEKGRGQAKKSHEIWISPNGSVSGTFQDAVENATTIRRKQIAYSRTPIGERLGPKTFMRMTDMDSTRTRVKSFYTIEGDGTVSRERFPIVKGQSIKEVRSLELRGAKGRDLWKLAKSGAYKRALGGR